MQENTQNPVPQNTPTAPLAPEQPINKAGSSSSKAKVAIIIFLLISFLCCITVTITAGVIYYKNKSDKDSDKKEESTTEESQEPDKTEDDNGSDDNDASNGNSSDDDESNGDETTIGEDSLQPYVEEVIANTKNADTYRVHAVLTQGGEEMIIDVEYEAPDREHLQLEMEGKTGEEIAIGTNYYAKSTDTNNIWKEVDELSLIPFIDDGFYEIFERTSFGTKLQEKDGYSYIIVEKAGDSIELYINKNTDTIHKVIIDADNMISTIEFSDYNSASISIEAPI